MLAGLKNPFLIPFPAYPCGLVRGHSLLLLSSSAIAGYRSTRAQLDSFGVASVYPLALIQRVKSSLDRLT